MIAGENVIFENEGYSRVFGGWYDTAEDNVGDLLGYTATFTSTPSTGPSEIVTFSGGDCRNDFNPYQHVLIDRKLYLVVELIDATHARVLPRPDDTGTGFSVRRVPTLHALNTKRGSLYAGNPVKVRGEAIFAAGRGPLKVAGAAISAALTASTTPQVAYPIAGGTYDVRNVGFTKPASLPSLSAVPGGTKNMPTEAFSIKLTKKRLGFEGYGPASEAIEGATLTAGQRYELTLPAFSTSEGQTAWLIWATKSRRGESVRGPWYLLGEYTTVGSAIQIEWRDKELTDELVDNNDTPPPCLYCLTFNDLVLMCSFGDNAEATGYKAGGPGVAVSKPFNVEGYPAEAHAWVTPAEDITLAKAGSTYCFFGTSNSLSYGSLARSDISPLVIRPFWHTGTSHNYSGVMAGDVFYVLTGDMLIRTATGQDVQYDFSAGVKSILSSIANERAFVGYDAKNGFIVIFASNYRVGTGGYYQTMALSYNMKTGTWNTPCYLGTGSGADFTVTGCCSINDALYFATSAGDVYQWDRASDGLGELSGFIATPFNDGGASQYLKIARRFVLNGELDGEAKLYRDYNYAGLVAGTGTVPTRSLTNAPETPRHTSWRPNHKGRSFAVRLSFTMTPGIRLLDDFALEVEGRDGIVY